MEFKKIKAYTFINFLNQHCKFCASGVSQVVFKGGIQYEEADIADGQNMVIFRVLNWQAYDYYITLQKPTVVTKREKGKTLHSIPHYLIPYRNIADNDSVVTNKLTQIETVGDFISLFYPAPTNITFKICINKKSRDLTCLGDSYDEVMKMPIKSVDYLKTCIRINA